MQLDLDPCFLLAYLTDFHYHRKMYTIVKWEIYFSREKYIPVFSVKLIGKKLWNSKNINNYVCERMKT